MDLPEKTTIFRVVFSLSVGGRPFTSWGGGVTALGAIVDDCVRVVKVLMLFRLGMFRVVLCNQVQKKRRVREAEEKRSEITP
jgi:hypothetical protein